MKGLLYTFVQQYKALWITSAALLVAITAGMSALIAAAGNEPEQFLNAAVILIQLMPLVAPLILAEPINRCMERYINCRFLNYQLCGVTAGKFVLTELVKSLAITVIGVAIVALELGIFYLVDEWFFSRALMLMQIEVVILGNAITYLCIPLTIKLRSQEKSGLILGITCAAAMIYPIFNMVEDMNEEQMPDLSSFFDKPETLLWCIGISAVIYAVTSAILHIQIKRGDLC